MLHLIFIVSTMQLSLKKGPVCVCVCTHGGLVASASACLCSRAYAGILNTLWFFFIQDIDYSHMTVKPFPLPPLCPAFVLWLWNCIFNQSHPMCVEISIWQSFSVQNKYTCYSEGLVSLVLYRTNFLESSFQKRNAKLSVNFKRLVSSMSGRMRINRLERKL